MVYWVQRPHKSLLIWQSLLLFNRRASSYFPLSLSLTSSSFLAGDPSTAPLRTGSCRLKGSETIVKSEGLFDDRWWMWSSAKLPLYFCNLPTAHAPVRLFVSAHFVGWPPFFLRKIHLRDHRYITRLIINGWPSLTADESMMFTEMFIHANIIKYLEMRSKQIDCTR